MKSALFSFFIVSRLVATLALGFIPKLPPKFVYNQPAAKPRPTYTPKTTPRETKDPCKLPGVDCNPSFPSTTTDFAAATTDFAGAATTSTCDNTDAACWNCALAYASMYDWQAYDTNFFSWDYAYQASALCYTPDAIGISLIWAPGFFDAPYSYCPQYWSTAGDAASVSVADANLGFCSTAGNFLQAYYTYTNGPTIDVSAAAQVTGVDYNDLFSTADGVAASATSSVSSGSSLSSTLGKGGTTGGGSMAFSLTCYALTVIFFGVALL